jgi:mycothiol system anti-sigma-R factor
MDCEHAHLRVYEYLDGELTVWKRLAITRHLDDCPPCAEGFTFEIDLRRVIVSKCSEDVPSELKTRIAIALGIIEAIDPASE